MTLQWSRQSLCSQGVPSRISVLQLNRGVTGTATGTLVSRVDTVAVCEEERVAHVCCAALAQCTPVHAHCGDPCMLCCPEKAQCAVCQSCYSSHLVDVSRSPTKSFACCVGLVGRRRLEKARVQKTFRDPSSSNQQVTRLDCRPVFGPQSEKRKNLPRVCQFPWSNSRCTTLERVWIFPQGPILPL